MVIRPHGWFIRNIEKYTYFVNYNYNSGAYIKNISDREQLIRPIMVYYIHDISKNLIIWSAQFKIDQSVVTNLKKI